MRLTLSVLALVPLAMPAAAQTSHSGQNPAAQAERMQDYAARLNHAAQSDPRAREAIQQAEKRLNEANHPAGKMLETTRP